MAAYSLYNSKEDMKTRNSKSGLSNFDDSFEILCELCNEYGDSFCPHHSSSYSTDEACSSKADACLGLSKGKHGKISKQLKESSKQH